MARPTLINQFRAGFTGQYSTFNPENQGLDLAAFTVQNWGYGTSLAQNPRVPVSSWYPLLSANDTVNWQRGDHSLTFGGTWYREHDHYWNGPNGYPRLTFGIATQDPVAGAFTSALSNANNVSLTNAQNLYAALTGRISAANTSHPLDPATKKYKEFGQYNLNELVAAAGFFAQDRWRIRPNLTLNYGLRWDIIGDNHAVLGDYTSPRTIADLWGPTPVGAMFSPGTLGGVDDPRFQAKVHVYKTQWVNPQPAFALAWTPSSNGFLGRLLGKGNTVVRAGFSLRNYTEGQQNFWAFGSSSGAFFYQTSTLTANNSGAVGTFRPGSLTLGDPLPPFAGFPVEWAPNLPASSQTFSTSQFWAMNPNIRPPYVQEWNIGIQREIGSGSAIEIRYVGNKALHAWLSHNLNETNIFENGFLPEFIDAQNNLRINQANGMGNTFANSGLAGQRTLPILTAAFGSATAADFRNGGFITNLQNGAAGTMAETITRNQGYICNMFGAKFKPCADRGVTSAGAGYPINFWQVNPYATGRNVNFLDASGKSGYHGLQMEFRQRPVYGFQFNVNYTLSRSLGLIAQNAIQGQGSNIYFTNRNFRLNYAPSAFDIRHVFHASGTYDLPYPKGKRFYNILGDWTLGTIVIFQTGTPVLFGGGFATMNQNDAGVVFKDGFTVADLQKTVGVKRSGSPWAYYVDPNVLTSIVPQTTPGVLGYRPYIYGPHWFNADLSVNKIIPIRERWRARLQAEFLNVFNHPTWSAVQQGTSTADIQSLTFGQTTGGPTRPRVVEFRLNLEF